MNQHDRPNSNTDSSFREAGWHADSWNRCLWTTLPELLAERLPLASYSVDRNGATLTVRLGVTGADGAEVRVEFADIPGIDGSGSFLFRDREVVVVPKARTERLERVMCCGEQLLEFLEPRVSQAPERYFTDSETLASWVPLSEWVAEFFLERAQVIDDRNALSRVTHLNRIVIEDRKEVSSTEQLGLVCPIETPEGPNIGRVLTVALGATIEDGEIRRCDDSPGGGLGPAASLIPFVERSDPARTLMGANMMRQWIPPLEPEPPLVVTGNEPTGREFSNGYNLLTAFLSLGPATCEDGMVLSRSAAARMRYDGAVEIGDKFSNRHGQKGVISDIREDRDMPTTSDGRVVDLVCGPAGLHTRMNTGQLFEAVAGNIAVRNSANYTAPPFASPSRAEMRREPAEAGLREDGMVAVLLPGGNPTAEVICGPIYWGRTVHIAEQKLHTFVTPGRGQRMGAMEYWVLRDARCYHMIAETIGIRAEDHPDAYRLADRIASGEELPAVGAGPGSAADSQPLRRLTETLRRAGIDVVSDHRGLSFGWSDEDGYELAYPVKHPWNPARRVHRIPQEDPPPSVTEENERLRRLAASNAPDSIVDRSRRRLAERIAEYFDGLFSSKTNDCLPTGSSLFSGRAVIVPAVDLPSDRVGIPDEMAWTLYRPLLDRSGLEHTEENLDRLMTDSWLILNRAPTINETAVIAFRPARVPHRSIALNPLVCRWLNADFDGDQTAVFLPLSKAAQAEVGRRLSVVGHLERDPSRLDSLLPPHEALWGLSWLSLSEAGRRRIEEITGRPVKSADRQIRVEELMESVRDVLTSDGAAQAVTCLESLMRLGFEASVACRPMSPWFELPDAEDESIATEFIESAVDYSDPMIGGQLLYAKAGIRGETGSFLRLARRRGDEAKHGLLDGLSASELSALAMEVRRHIASFVDDVATLGERHSAEHLSKATTVLARAARSDRPGVVFASAAERGEIDPLTDVDAALFAGRIPQPRDDGSAPPER